MNVPQGIAPAARHDCLGTPVPCTRPFIGPGKATSLGGATKKLGSSGTTGAFAQREPFGVRRFDAALVFLVERETKAASQRRFCAGM
jgi:hypothetical protein